MPAGRADAETVTELGRSDDPGEVNHLVCCRESWAVTLCGIADKHPINLASAFLCVMCVETITRLRPTWRTDDPPICPLDQTPCPPEEEIDERIARATGAAPD